MGNVLIMALGSLDRGRILIALRRKEIGVHDMLGNLLTVLLVIDLIFSKFWDGWFLRRVCKGMIC